MQIIPHFFFVFSPPRLTSPVSATSSAIVPRPALLIASNQIDKSIFFANNCELTCIYRFFFVPCRLIMITILIR
jgi:hypothetical protein